MKKIIITIICILNFTVAFAQDGHHFRGGFFTKVVEFNLARETGERYGNGYNLNSKGDIEKQFFGDFNAPIEFFYLPGQDDPAPWENRLVCSGFRIMRDSLDKNYVLQIKRSFAKTDDIDSISVFISDQFANKMHDKMSSLIHNYKGIDTLSVVFDGYKIMSQSVRFVMGDDNVFFRAVVQDEVWSLKIFSIPNGNALKMSDLCWQIMTDAENDKFEEAKYSKLLDEFAFRRSNNY